MHEDNIYQEYGEFVFKYSLTLTNDFDSAEELTQETFYQAIKSIDNYHDDGNSKFSTWLCSIAKNLWLQEINRKNKKHKLVTSLNIESPSIYSLEEEYIRSEDLMELFKMTHQLNEDKKEIIYLRLLGDLSFKEIGIIFDKTENWARVTFYRARQQLKKLKKEDMNYES